MTPLPKTQVFSTLEDYQIFVDQNRERELAIQQVEEGLTRDDQFNIQGYCGVCERPVDFHVDYNNCHVDARGRRTPNWRERLECPNCLLNNRMRAVTCFMLSTTDSKSNVYVTEAITPLFRALSSRRHKTVGSEYLRDGTRNGDVNTAGVRNEDVTAMTFESCSFDVIGSFDVLEHVPDYKSALAEFYRCLRAGGRLFLTVPFSLTANRTVTRAEVGSDGAIKHLQAPEYHGDPLDPNGTLCFYDHGWHLLSAMSDVGFQEVNLHLFWDMELGYLGGYQYIITARRAPKQRWWFPKSQK